MNRFEDEICEHEIQNIRASFSHLEKALRDTKQKIELLTLERRKRFASIENSLRNSERRGMPTMMSRPRLK